MALERVRKWLNGKFRKQPGPINQDSITLQIREYREKLRTLEPGSTEHLEMQSKINELKALKGK